LPGQQATLLDLFGSHHHESVFAKTPNSAHVHTPSPTPFPLSKLAPLNAASSPKLADSAPSTSKSSVSPTKPSSNVAPIMKQLNPKSECQPTLDHTPSIELCKVDDKDEIKEEQTSKRAVPRKKSNAQPQASGSKSKPSKHRVATANDVVNISSLSSEDGFVGDFITKREVSNNKSMELLGKDWEIKLLQIILEAEKAKSTRLKIRILELEYQMKVQEGVKAELARRDVMAATLAPLELWLRLQLWPLLLFQPLP
ncbi:hypothetical protein FRC11_008818, partial [Ceratobasidium sp. 423]